MSKFEDLTIKDIYKTCTWSVVCFNCPICKECHLMFKISPFEWFKLTKEGSKFDVKRYSDQSEEQSEDHGTESVGQGDTESAGEGIRGDEAVKGRCFEGSPGEFWEDSVCRSGVVSTFLGVDNSGTAQTGN